MTDDFSNLVEGAQCYVLSNSSTIYAYKNNVRSTYLQISGKWVKSAESTYNNIPVNTYCISYNDITSLSSYSYWLPVYSIIAFILAVFVFGLVWSIFRRLGRWRV